jgi:hypothetical protein
MSALETLSLASMTLGVLAILRFVWVDSLRFHDDPVAAEVADSEKLSDRTTRRIALQAEADRVAAENSRLPRAA